MPVTNRLAIIVDGKIADIDQVNSLLDRYSEQGYTVVVHLKDEVDVNAIFQRYFSVFVINDTSDVEYIFFQLISFGSDNCKKTFIIFDTLKNRPQLLFFLNSPMRCY